MTLKRRNRATANAVKNVARLTLNAPQARTNGVSGKGGGIKAVSPSAIAPLSLILPCMDFSRRSGIQHSRLFSPILEPILKVIYEPTTDPAVAIGGNAQNMS